jgi:hypothetical protein
MFLQPQFDIDSVTRGQVAYVVACSRAVGDPALHDQLVELGKLADPYFSELQRCIVAGR